MSGNAVKLERYAYTEQGTFGRIFVSGSLICRCIERPWAGNRPMVSCIPEGIYPMRKGMYNRGGYPAYEVLDVHDRSLIKIHRANRSSELAGCIAPGVAVGVVGGEWAVTSSAVALERFMMAVTWIQDPWLWVTFGRGVEV